MAEKLNFHLLELARAKRKVSRRNFVAETFADLRNAEWNPHTRAVANVFEVDENALGRLGTQENNVILAAQSADDRFEHQVEFARRCQRAERLGVRSQYLRKIANRCE